MTKEQEAREALDNAVYNYIETMGEDGDMVDYSTLDEWLEDVTGKSNPLGSEEVIE